MITNARPTVADITDQNVSVASTDIGLACRDFEPINQVLDYVSGKTGEGAEAHIRSLIWDRVRFPVMEQTVFQGRDQIALQVRDEQEQ